MGGVEKAHPASRSSAPPTTALLPLDFLQRQQKFPERGARANSNRADRGPCGRRRPCGPVMCFLRARCSWSTLNKGNNVTATVNSLGCSCQQDVPNQSRNSPVHSTTHCFSFRFPPARVHASHGTQRERTGERATAAPGSCQTKCQETGNDIQLLGFKNTSNLKMIRVLFYC